MNLVKEKIGDALGYPPDQLRLIYAGIELKEGTVSSYNILEGGTIHIVLKLRGGLGLEFSINVTQIIKVILIA